MKSVKKIIETIRRFVLSVWLWLIRYNMPNFVRLILMTRAWTRKYGVHPNAHVCALFVKVCGGIKKPHLT
jgi:hypothetical protein